MKTLTQKLALAALAGLLTTAAFGQNGTWTNALSSNWSDTASWLDAIVADSAGNTATFAADLTTNNATATITLDTARTLGHLTFTDPDVVTPGSLGNYTIAAGAGLILDDTSRPDSILTVNLATGTAANLVTGWELATLGLDITTTNVLVKSGPGHLVLNPATANTLSGGMVISNGMVQLGVASTTGTANTAAPGAGPVIFRGGSLRLQNAAIPGSSPGNGGGGIPGLAAPVVVEPNQTGTVYLPPRSFPAFNSAVHGGGTLNLVVDFVRDNLGGDWSGFTGKVVVAASARGNSDLRIDCGAGRFVPGTWSNCIVSFTNNGVNANTVFMYNSQPIGNNIEIGALEASIPGIVTLISGNTTVNAGGANSAPFVLTVGALNLDTSFSGNFTAGAGSVSLVKVGAGSLTLNGPTVDYTGSTVISNGVLQFGAGTSGTIGRSAVVSNYSAIAFGRSDTTYAVTNLIDGPGALIQRGAGRTTLSPAGGANPYRGRTFVTNGTLAVAAEAALGAIPASFVADQLTLNGGSLAATTSLTLDDANRGITVGANGGGLGADGANTLTVASVIGGSGALTINNTGDVALTGANNFGGRTVLASGTLVLASENLGVAPGVPSADQLTLNGGRLRSTATFAIDDANRGISLGAAGGTFAPDAGTTLTLSESISGSGVLIKSGAGTLVINGADTHSGLTLVNQGTLAFGAAGATASPHLSVPAGSALDVSAMAGGLVLGTGQKLSGNGTIVGNVTVNAGATLSAGASVGLLTLAGNLTLNGGTNSVEISELTNDVVNVTGNLTLSGVSTINLTLLASLPVGTYPLIKYAGTISGSVANLQLAGYPLSRLSAALSHNVGSKSMDLVISGTSGALVWQGGLNGNAWDVASTTNWLNGGSPDYFLNGDGVTFNDAGAANNGVNLVGALSAGPVAVNAVADYTFGGSGKITGTASLAKSGVGTLNVLTANDHSGDTTISSGTVRVGNGVTGGALGGNIVNNAALAYNLPGDSTVANVFSGSGNLTVEAGSVILTGNNSGTGGTVIQSGAIVQVGNGGATGSLNSGSVTDNGALVYNRTAGVTNHGAISGSGSLTVQGGGSVYLAADSSYAGPTIVNGATLHVGVGGAAGSLGTAASVTVSNAGTLAFKRSDEFTNSAAVIGGTGTLRQIGTGTLVITNEANSYGATHVFDGRLQLGDGASPSGRLGTGNVTVSSPGVLAFNRPDVYLLTNVVTGSGGLAQIGPTNLQITVLGNLGAGNSFSGGTVISNAELELVPAATSPAEAGFFNANERGLGTGPVTFQGNSTLRLASHNGGEVANGNAQGAGNFANAISVPAGQSGRIVTPGRFTMSGAVTGAGALELSVMHVRADITANFSAFTGQINVTPNTNAMTVVGGITPITAFDFRSANNAGYPNARLHLGANDIYAASMYSRAAANAQVPIGELSGDPGTSLRSTSGGGGSPGANETWVIGGLNTDATFAGTLLDGNSFVKVGTGKWTLTAVNTHTGNTSISNGVVSLEGDGALTSSANIILAAPGLLAATNAVDGAFHLGTAAASTLAGNSTVEGDLIVESQGTVSPGFSIGNLSVTGIVTNRGALFMGIDRNATPNCDTLTALGFTNESPSLTVSNAGGGLRPGDSFRLLVTTPVANNITGGFASVTLPTLAPGFTWTDTTATDGRITVSGSGPTVTSVIAGNWITNSWDTAYLGWRLQVQTNAANVGISGNWVDVPGSESVTSVAEAIDPANPSVFYRLVY